jgi:hypothetical protein
MTWSLLGNAQFGFRWIGTILVQPTNPNTVYVRAIRLAGGGEIWRSTDGGTTWSSKKTEVGSVYRQNLFGKLLGCGRIDDQYFPVVEGEDLIPFPFRVDADRDAAGQDCNPGAYAAADLAFFNSFRN